MSAQPQLSSAPLGHLKVVDSISVTGRRKKRIPGWRQMSKMLNRMIAVLHSLGPVATRLLSFLGGVVYGALDLCFVPLCLAGFILGTSFYLLPLVIFFPSAILGRIPLVGKLGASLIRLGLLVTLFMVRLLVPARIRTAPARLARASFFKLFRLCGVPLFLVVLCPIAVWVGLQWSHESYLWIFRHLRTVHVKIHDLPKVYLFLLASWVVLRGAWFAIPAHLRGQHNVSGTDALRPGESWTKNDHMSDSEKKEHYDRFERATAAYFAARGYAVRVNGTQLAKSTIGHKGSGDGGVDVFAFKESQNPPAVVVSCKCYKDPVSVEYVREIFGNAHSVNFSARRVASIIGEPFSMVGGPSGAVLATTTGLTRDAELFARENGILVYVFLDNNQVKRIA